MLDGLAANTRVFGIEWHVDYWDYLGHKDPYASEVFTERQTAYAIAFDEEYLFTPQLMVNTVTQQPPSTSKVNGAVGQALGVQVPASVTLWQDTAAEALVIHYKVDGVPADAELHLVMVEGGIERFIPAGENAGKTLYHEAAARWYATMPAERGWVTVGYAPDVVLENARFIAFLQSPGTMQIHGATQLVKLEPYPQ